MIQNVQMRSKGNSRVRYVDIGNLSVPMRFTATPPNKKKIKLKREMIQGGYIPPILVDKTGVIVDNYITYLILNEMGEKEAPVIICNENEVVNRTYSRACNVINMYKLANGRCYICNRVCNFPGSGDSGNKDNLDPTVDHVIPLSKGGRDDESNMRLCCNICNGLKGSFTYSEELRTVILRELNERGLL